MLHILKHIYLIKATFHKISLLAFRLVLTTAFSRTASSITTSRQWLGAGRLAMTSAPLGAPHFEHLFAATFDAIVTDAKHVSIFCCSYIASHTFNLYLLVLHTQMPSMMYMPLLFYRRQNFIL